MSNYLYSKLRDLSPEQIEKRKNFNMKLIRFGCLPVISFFLLIFSISLFVDGSTFGGSLLLTFFLVTLYFVFFGNKAARAARAASASHQQQLFDEALAQFNQIKESRTFPTVESPLLLSNGEQAHYIYEHCILSEVGSVSERNTAGGAMRVAKGVYIGGSHSQSQSHSVIKQIDRGTLILTGKALYFKGSMTLRTIPLAKILAIDISTSGMRSYELALSITGGSKKEFFSVDNPFLWNQIIKLFKFIDEKQIPMSQVDLNINLGADLS